MPLFNAAERRLCMDLWNALPGSLVENGTMIYTNLFKSNPEMKELFQFLADFQGDPATCPALVPFVNKFMKKLDITINQLDTPAIMAADLKNLGSRHPGYNVNPNKHVAPMKAAFLGMLKARLGGKFNGDAQSAWSKCFDEITNLMLR